MLTTLANFPKLNLVAKSNIPEMTRLIVHEIGHIVAAAAVSIPTDFLVIDEAFGAIHHGGYIDEAYRPWLDLPFYRMARIRILTAGLAAELAIFGAADLAMSSEDLSSIANLLGFAKSDGWMMNTAHCVMENYQPVLPPGAVNAIKKIYPKIVCAIQGQRHLVDNAHVIPFSAFDDVLLQLSHGHRERALDRTKEECHRRSIVAKLRGGVGSGV
ncbi:MAG: hypothetical protein ACREEK_22685 [Bradyrhizobium sp.]